MLAAMEAVQGKARPDDNSVVPPIDRLALLPQTMIMQMAQKGQIPKEDVLPIMNKKNENAQAAAQIKAVAQQMAQQQQMGGPPPSTVFEKVMAQNAAREVAPMTRKNTGIANVPMQKQMFAGKRAGGIVAFAGQEGSFVSNQERLKLLEKRIAEAKTPNFADLMERQNLTAIIGRNKVGEDYQKLLSETGLPDIPMSEILGAVGEKLTPPSPKYEYGQLLEPETKKFPTIEKRNQIIEERKQAKLEPSSYKARPGSMTPAELEADMKRAGAEDRAIEKETFAQEQLDEEAKQKKVLGRPKEEIVGLQDQINEMANTSIAAFDKLGFDKPEKFDPSKFNTEALRTELQENGVNLNLLSEQAGALAEEKLKLDKDKKQALAFFGLEAGLNILAGKDPNALVNIGAGAGKAIAPLRKELTRIKDQHNALRKEQNALAKMQNDQDMGIAKFSLKRFDAAKERAAKAKESYERTKATFVAQNARTIVSLKTGMAQAEATRASTQMRQDQYDFINEFNKAKLGLLETKARQDAIESVNKTLLTNKNYQNAKTDKEKQDIFNAELAKILPQQSNLTSKLNLEGFRLIPKGE